MIKQTTVQIPWLIQNLPITQDGEFFKRVNG